MYTNRKSGIGRGGQVLTGGVMHMAAVLAGYGKGLVGTGWTISLVSSTNVHKNCSSAFVGLYSFA